MRFLLAVWFAGLIAFSAQGQCANGTNAAPKMTVYERRVEYTQPSTVYAAAATRYLTVQSAPVPTITYVPAATVCAVPTARVYAVPFDVRSYDNRGPIRRFFNTR